MNSFDQENVNENPEGEEGIVQSHEDVDPKREKMRIESRLEEIDNMDTIDDDAAEERRILERKLDNLKETLEKGL